MRKRAFTLARLGPPPGGFPHVVWYDDQWCLRVGPGFGDWRALHTLDELLAELSKETIEPYAKRRELLEGLLASRWDLLAVSRKLLTEEIERQTPIPSFFPCRYHSPRKTRFSPTDAA